MDREINKNQVRQSETKWEWKIPELCMWINMWYENIFDEDKTGSD